MLDSTNFFSIWNEIHQASLLTQSQLIQTLLLQDNMPLIPKIYLLALSDSLPRPSYCTGLNLLFVWPNSTMKWWGQAQKVISLHTYFGSKWGLLFEGHIVDSTPLLFFTRRFVTLRVQSSPIQSKVRGEYETNWQRTNVWMLFDVKK